MSDTTSGPGDDERDSAAGSGSRRHGANRRERSSAQGESPPRDDTAPVEGGDGEPGAAGARETPPKPTPMTQQIGRIAIVVLAVLFAVFAIANSQPVDFSWVFGDTRVRQPPGGDVAGGVPLILLLLAAFAFGAVISALLQRQVRRKRQARRATRREQG